MSCWGIGDTEDVGHRARRNVNFGGRYTIARPRCYGHKATSDRKLMFLRWVFFFTSFLPGGHLLEKQKTGLYFCFVIILLRFDDTLLFFSFSYF